MSRIGWVLTGLLSVLLIVGWFFLLWQPTSDDIEQVRQDTDATLTQAQQQRQIAARLREVRETAPEIEARLAAGQVLIPEGPALPALFRQLQEAADDSGLRLTAVSPGRPADVADAPTDLSRMQVNVSLEGSFFQLVDFSRRLEDPGLTGRGLLWRTAAVSFEEDIFPALNVSLSAEVFARMDADTIPAPEEAEEGADAEGEEPTDTDDEPVEPATPPDEDDEDEVL